MKLLRDALLMSVLLSSAGCGGSKAVDPVELNAKLSALNDRACACKDVACMKAADQEHMLLSVDVRAVDKSNKEYLSKLAELEVTYMKCMQQAMGAEDKKRREMIEGQPGQPGQTPPPPSGPDR